MVWISNFQFSSELLIEKAGLRKKNVFVLTRYNGKKKQHEKHIMTIFWYDAQKFKLEYKGCPCVSKNPMRDVSFKSLRDLEKISRFKKCWVLNLFVKNLQARKSNEARRVCLERKRFGAVNGKVVSGKGKS